MKTEDGALWLSAAAALMIGCVGVVCAWMTNSQAILLDGAFNLTYFIIALLTIKVAQIVKRPDTEDYPLGFSYFEPLINGTKGVLIFGISMLALFDAVSTLMKGGRSFEVGPAIGYAAFATVVCLAVAILLRRARKKTRSPLVEADAAGWMVNCAISGAVFVTFCAVPVISAMGMATFVPYVDPLLVSLVILISLSVPVRIAWQALLAMLNRAPPLEVRAPIVATIRDALADLPKKALYVRMIRPGRILQIAVYVVLPEDFHLTGLQTLDAVRARITESVRRRHGAAIVDVIFTADEYWAAPISGAEAEPTGPMC